MLASQYRGGKEHRIQEHVRIFFFFNSKRSKHINERWRHQDIPSRFLAMSAVILIVAAQYVYGQHAMVGSKDLPNVSGEEYVSFSNITSEKNTSTTSAYLSNGDTSSIESKVQNNLNRKSVTSPSVSLNRNALLSFDNILQRQLREKARLDSLESIKMHILMRLNLKKLPNITKPIPVPQNILDNFYKDYNVSSKHERWSRTAADFDKSVISTQSSVLAPHVRESTSQKQDANSYSQMQKDDADTLKEFQIFYRNDHKEDTRNREEYESILSHISSIYIFPEQTQPHVRNNRITEVLRFNIANSYSDLSFAVLHLYLRGWEWICKHQPQLIEEIKKQHSKDIVVTIHRAVRRGNTANFTHKAKIFEFRQRIPLGLGQWINVDLKPFFSIVGTNNTQEIVINGVRPWMKPLIVTTDKTSKNPLTVHIEIGSQKKHRRKRSVYMDCTENDHDMRCCRYPLKVNFTSFGWHFVVAPTSFDAYFCSGDCRVGYLEQYPHTHLAALTTSATPCCSPTKMSSLSLLYFDDNHNLVLSVIPNMSVEGCSCS